MGGTPRYIGAQDLFLGLFIFKNIMKPLSKNIIFVDTEFSSLNPYEGEIISIGIVKMNGKSLYLELEYSGKLSPWVKRNILSDLNQKKVSRKNAIKKIKQFVGKSNPYVVGYAPQYDALYLNKLFGVNKCPFRWLVIDFASILFSDNIDPEEFFKPKSKFLKKLGINLKDYKQHNALDDAKLLREAYIKFFKLKSYEKK